MTLADRPTQRSKTSALAPAVGSAVAVDSQGSFPSSRGAIKPTRTEVYDPEAIRHLYQGQYLKVLWRWIMIIWPLGGFILNRWWDRRTGKAQAREHQRAVQLRQMLTTLGPAYIKIGQALSTRPDVLPAAYLDELAKLQDQLPPFANEIAFQFIEEELGQPPAQLYAELTPEPIAAASLGQVYKGRLYSGEWVAVKVQRPDLAEKITLDIYLLRSLAAWAQRQFGNIRSDLVGILDEFAGRLFEEMDYTLEGRNAERFAELYGYLEEIYVPKIYWNYTHTRVLTMEWITGTKLNHPDRIMSQGIDARHLIDVGVQCSLRQLLEHGFFHADPHPGNLLAMPNGKLAYLDFGMMSEINIEQRYGLINAIVHIVNREFEALAQDYVNLGFLTPETDLTPIIPALGMVFDNALGASVAELNIQRIFDQLSEIMYEYPFRVPAYYALIVRSLLTMEGIALGVDPNFKVLNAAYPYVAKRLLTDPAPELRTSLRELLFKDGNFRWNRLENLLRNARTSSDYDLSGAINQALDFLFSERGEFIRDRIAHELVNNLDHLGQNTLQTLLHSIRHYIGINGTSAPSSTPDATTQKNFQHMQQIWTLLQDAPGFEPLELLSAIADILGRPETHRLGRQVASGLAQKAAARLIREFLISETPPTGRSIPTTRPLPSAKLRP
ncbi:AarF/ABC1/UbiB kinase family protein [Synechococcales cyanobacterium C]|uniref:AarF/ABC1/UbiB kinase family protein n=1 Tax=Petrachloros mirabilis ULC683 TaxID=2781853 RepID=A0A8K1ZXI0_9CYAN|nr:AarF/ABC1/UbiB kinase family protein [Petrachloros mirabilis]NCJ06723.1 AarF/ABC1/UbiB kinase family protein [Petrachloros mirabilis ULC683]